MHMLRRATASAAAISIFTVNVAVAQVVPAPATQEAAQPVAAVSRPVIVAPPTMVGASLRIPEGTEVRIRFDDDLSSKTSTQGDRFSISLDEPITLSDGTIVPRGYRGVGEVSHAQKNGMLGKGGELNVRFEYIKIGDHRLRLRGSQGREGKGAMGATIVLTVLFGPLGLLMKGKNIEIKRGQVITAYVDSDVLMPLPLPAPVG